MISILTGKIIEKNPPSLVLDVAGVGYEVHTPMTTYSALGAIGDTHTLFIHFVVREDAQLLYGFQDKLTREVFHILLKTSGVGPKLALTILSGMEIPLLITTLQNKDAVLLSKIPGIGKKTAERLIVETCDKVLELNNKFCSSNTNTAQPHTVASKADNTFNDALSALVSLGYKKFEAIKVLNKLSQDCAQDSEALIRLALQQMIS